MRFRDNHDGTVTDTRTGLVWLKDAGRSMDLNSAVEWAYSLADGKHGLADGSFPGDWVLPSRK